MNVQGCVGGSVSRVGMASPLSQQVFREAEDMVGSGAA